MGGDIDLPEALRTMQERISNVSAGDLEVLRRGADALERPEKERTAENETVPLDMALAARNEIVRQMGECRVPLITLLDAMRAAERVKAKSKH